MSSSESSLINFCRRSSGVEHRYGKAGVTSSILVGGSIRLHSKELRRDLCSHGVAASEAGQISSAAPLRSTK